MKEMIIGYIGLGVLVLAYIVLLTRFSKWFLLIDALGSLLLTIHAFLIFDIPFIIVNSFIFIVLLIKHYKGGIR